MLRNNSIWLERSAKQDEDDSGSAHHPFDIMLQGRLSRIAVHVRWDSCCQSEIWWDFKHVFWSHSDIVRGWIVKLKQLQKSSATPLIGYIDNRVSSQPTCTLSRLDSISTGCQTAASVLLMCLTRIAVEKSYFNAVLNNLNLSYGSFYLSWR